MLLDPDEYEAARQCRDPRFDGRFFVGVLTTGIYCRPVCPVRIPKKENIQLYESAAAAAAAGFRPCLRCRPESSPGTPAWTGSSWKVSRALQLIDQGFLDTGSVDELAAQLEVGVRQLHRLFSKHLGASPIEVAQTRRLHFGKKLIDETRLPLSEVCFAAGFGSLRRFNAVFQDTYGRSPRELRKRKQSALTAGKELITLTLDYRPPLDWRAMLGFLAYRAIPGVEVVGESTYARTFRLDDCVGDFKANFDTGKHTVDVAIRLPNTRYLFQIVDRIRNLFDLRADSDHIDDFFAKDKVLGNAVRHFPGTRVPGCWDGLEVAVRAILGQQVTVRAATTLVARVVERFGSPYEAGRSGCKADSEEGISEGDGDNAELSHVFPDAATLVAADLQGLGIVGQRIAAIQAMAEQVANGELRIDCTVPTADFVAQVCQIKGIGDWTAHYIAMRALNDPNAFPYSDLILRRAAAPPDTTLTPKQLLELSQQWLPWRAYAVILLWRLYGLQNQEPVTAQEPGQTK